MYSQELCEQIQLASHKNEKPLGSVFKVRARDPRASLVLEIWEDYDENDHEVLLKSYREGVPSVTMTMENLMYEFDFGKMEQKCLTTMEVRKMSPPSESASELAINVTGNSSRCCETTQKKHPMLAVRVPPNGRGKVISVPHPRKLGKTFKVMVPKDAIDGKHFFVPMPRKKLIQKVTYAVGGTIYGVCTTLAVDAVAEGSRNPTIVGFVGVALGLALLGAVAIGAVALARGCKCNACIPGKFVEMCGAKKVKYAVVATIGGVCATIAVDAVKKGALFGGSIGKIGFAGLAPSLALLGAVAIGAAALGACYYVSKYVAHNPGKIVAIGAATVGSSLVLASLEPLLGELANDVTPEVPGDWSPSEINTFVASEDFDINSLIDDDSPADCLEWVSDFLFS